MNQAAHEKDAGHRPGAEEAVPRPGQSGEGARTALEQLIQQQRRRQAQMPHVDDGDRLPPQPPRG